MPQNRHLILLLGGRDDYFCVFDKYIMKQPSRKSIQSQHDIYQPWYQQKIACWKSLVEDHLEVIRLSSNTYLIWNFVYFMTMFYSFLTNLFVIFILSLLEPGLANDIPFNQVNKYLNIVIPIIDILFVRWRVERFDGEETIIAHNELFKEYMKYYFAIDVMVVIIMIIDSADVDMEFWKLLIYSKVFVFVLVKEEISIAVKGNRTLEIIFKTIRLLTFVVFWSFFYACVFVTIELHKLYQNGYQAQNGFLWITTHPSVNYISLYDNFAWYVWFEYALFFVMQMVRGAGMGITSPRCPRSMLWYCVSNITMTVIWWYFTDKVVWLMAKINEKNLEVENLINLKELKKIKIISEKDYQDYGNFLKYAFTPRIETLRLYNQLQGMIPSHLWKEFNHRYKQHYLIRFFFLKSIIIGKREQDAFEKDLAQIIRSKTVYQGEFLYKQGQLSHQRLYLSELSHIIVENEDIVYRQKLPEWSFVGVREFFIDKRPFMDVISTKMTAIDYIEKEQFMNLLRQYPKMKELFCQKMDGILIQQQSTQTMQLKCCYCSKMFETTEFHLSQNCSVLRTNNQLGIRSIARQNRLYLRYNENLIDHNDRALFTRRYEQVGRVRGLKRSNLPEDQYRRRDTITFDFNIDILEFKKGPDMSQVLKLSDESQQEVYIGESQEIISF